MASPEDFVAPVLACLDPRLTIPSFPFSVGFDWPDLPEIGFPNFMLSMFGASFAGINYCLDFLPIDIEDLPSLPSINIFIAAFEASFNLPDVSFPSLPGISIPQYVIEASISLAIELPFQLTLTIVQSMINLSLELPTFQVVFDTLEGIALSLNIPQVSIDIWANCIANGIFLAFQEIA